MPALDFHVEAMLPLVLEGDENTFRVPAWQVWVVGAIDDLDSEVGPTVAARKGVSVQICRSPVRLLAEMFFPNV